MNSVIELRALKALIHCYYEIIEVICAAVEVKSNATGVVNHYAC